MKEIVSQRNYRNYIKKEAFDYSQQLKADFMQLVFGHISITMEKTPLAGLILILCAVDYLKSFYYGLMAIDGATLSLLLNRYKKDPQNKYLNGIKAKRKNIDRKPSYYYMAFLRKYLKPLNIKYKIDEIYSNLRCGLVHNYSDHIFKYDFIDNNDAKIGDRTKEHLSKCKRNNKYRVKFNINVFFKDFEVMCNNYWDDVARNPQLQMNIHDIKSYVGFMSVLPG